MARLTKAQREAVAAIVALGHTREEALGILGLGPKPARKPNTFHERVIKARVPCAYGVASCGRFAPNGVGSRQHTTCPKGRAALAKARK